jgi:CRISPR/Cas system-associated exonuclease Cas4 (RecB family)
VWCKRYPWLKKRAKIPQPKAERRLQGVAFHELIHGLFELVHKTLTSTVRGQVVKTELWLPQNVSLDKTFYLRGVLDVLRRVEDGYIVQEEKYSDPPEPARDKELARYRSRVRESDKVQLDAYAFLAEKSGYTPIKSGVVLYRDLRPREIEVNPERIPPLIMEVRGLLISESLPEKPEGALCSWCGYQPLCYILPDKGGLTIQEVREGLRELKVKP